jgi:hypothetical protein
MPTMELLNRFRGIHHSGKNLNMKLFSKPMSNKSRRLCVRWQAFDIPSKSRRLRD